MVDIAISAPARSIEAHAMSTSRLRITSRIETWWTSTSYIDTSSESGSMPWLIVRLPCGSRSTQSTRWSRSTNAAARLRVVVVLATPPFWFVKAMPLAVGSIRSAYSHVRGRFLPGRVLRRPHVPERIRRPSPRDHGVRVVAAFLRAAQGQQLEAGGERDLGYELVAAIIRLDPPHRDALRFGGPAALAQRDGGTVQQVLGVVTLGEPPGGLAQLERSLAGGHGEGTGRSGEHEQALGVGRLVQARILKHSLDGRRRGHDRLGLERLRAELSGDQRQHGERAGVAARVGLGALPLPGLDGLRPAHSGRGDGERLGAQGERALACGAGVGRLAGV